MFAMLQKFAGVLVGPFIVGPLFGRTCWTCLNPPTCHSPKACLLELASNTVEFNVH